MSKQEQVIHFDIFGIYSPISKNRILLTVSLIGALASCSDTIYLPALASVKSEFHVTDAEVAATVSSYMAACAIGQFAFGPLSDYCGRLKVLYSSFLVFFFITLGIALAPNINAVIVLRALQGFFVAGTYIPAQIIIADVFRPEERGTAAGLFFIPVLVGPIISPLIGGYLSAAYSFRACFILLLIVTILLVLLAYVYLPETHPWFAATSHMANPPSSSTTTTSTTPSIDPEAASPPPSSDSTAVSSSPSQLPSIHPPALFNPFVSLWFLLDIQLVPYFFASGLAFGCFFTSMTVLPLYLALPPYSLSSGPIGLSYLPVGCTQLVMAIVGGSLSDYSAAKFNTSLDGRMTLVLFAIWALVPGCIGFGYTAQTGGSLAGLLFSQALLGLGNSVMLPSVSAYLSSSRPHASGAVNALMMFLCFGVSAIAISFSIPIADKTSVAGFWLLMAMFALICSLLATGLNIRRVFLLPPTLFHPNPSSTSVSVSSSSSGNKNGMEMEGVGVKGGEVKGGEVEGGKEEEEEDSEKSINPLSQPTQ